MIAELFFRVVIPASNPPKACFDENELLYKFCPNQGSGVMTIGKKASIRTRWRVNNYGWNSDIDYCQEKSLPRIAIIGDSFIEAFQVDLKKSYHIIKKILER